MNIPFDLAITPSGKIYVVDRYNNRVQVFKEADIKASLSKAIIVAGRASSDDILWDATQMCTNSANRALTYQGFTKDSIYYLTSDTDLDLDSNGVLDDVDGEATKANLEYAITNWAKDAESLVLYFADHGGEDIFRMSETETLSSAELASWLDDFQSTTLKKVIAVYEACVSGSFIDDLSGDNRIIITSTLPGEKAKFLSHGTISFSSFFWTHIFNGLSVGEAHLNASQVINFAFDNQNPQLSGTAENIYIGNGVENMIGEAPEIGSVSPPQVIEDETSAVLYAEGVTDPDGIARVWAVIWPPDYNPESSDDPLLSLPTLELINTGGNRFEGTYTDFSKDGTYQIALYAMDGNNNTSIPRLTTVSRNYSLTRKALIVAGGEGAGILRPLIEKSAGLAYQALKSQLYTDDDIYVMSVTDMAGLDASPSLNNLESYINSFTGDSTIENLDLVIYLIGGGDTGSFKINDTESLTASALAGWLDGLQNSISCRVTLIYDADNSGSFILLLTPPEGKERILISSTCANDTAYFSEEGDISFSFFFWSQVSSGATVYDALAHAKKALSYLNRKNEISFSCYRQTPLIDADGNGMANEESDYQVARGLTIGVGMKFADDPPQIGSVSAEETEDGVTISAEDITSTSIIQRVWAVIKPVGYCPGYAAEKAADMPEVELKDPDKDGRYEGTYSDFSHAFKIVVYAMDEDNNTSLPKETKVYQTEGQDIYEVDDIRAQANVIVVNHSTPQPHNFHYAADEDWVKFYGLSGEYYTIEAVNLGTDCEPVIELYHEEDETPTAVDDTILNNRVSIDFECLEDGTYYVKLWNQTGVSEGDTYYDLRMYNPYWPSLLVLITGRVANLLTFEPIDGAFITTSGGGAAISVGGIYDLYQIPGTWTMEAIADGYVPFSDGISVDTSTPIIAKDVIMNPFGASTTTTTGSIINCFSEEIYGQHSEETELLRYFRDQVLNKTPEGKEIIRLYYLWSPAIVKAMEANEEFKETVKGRMDGILLLIMEEAE